MFYSANVNDMSGILITTVSLLHFAVEMHFLDSTVLASTQ